VLCLAARKGGEVRAFIAQGAFAVGIDLNPGRDNRYVLPGDFHDLQFADGSVHLVYTNSLDHAFDPDRLLAEVHRVLAPAGILMVEAGNGGHGVAGRGFYESFSWASITELVSLIEAAGFRLEAQQPFEQPVSGEHMRFTRSS
jgi:SAM-dependent methyltransferase